MSADTISTARPRLRAFLESTGLALVVGIAIFLAGRARSEAYATFVTIELPETSDASSQPSAAKRLLAIAVQRTGDVLRPNSGREFRVDVLRNQSLQLVCKADTAENAVRLCERALNEAVATGLFHALEHAHEATPVGRRAFDATWPALLAACGWFLVRTSFQPNNLFSAKEASNDNSAEWKRWKVPKRAPADPRAIPQPTTRRVAGTAARRPAQIIHTMVGMPELVSPTGGQPIVTGLDGVTVSNIVEAQPNARLLDHPQIRTTAKISPSPELLRRASSTGPEYFPQEASPARDRHSHETVPIPDPHAVYPSSRATLRSFVPPAPAAAARAAQPSPPPVQAPQPSAANHNSQPPAAAFSSRPPASNFSSRPPPAANASTTSYPPPQMIDNQPAERPNSQRPAPSSQAPDMERRRISTAPDLARRVIYHVSNGPWAGDPNVITHQTLDELRALRGEALREAHSPACVIRVTSAANSRYAKTQVAAQLAWLLAEDKTTRVLLMEADLDAPALGKVLRVNVPRGFGLSEQLERMAEVTNGESGVTLLKIGAELHALVESRHGTPSMFDSHYFVQTLAQQRGAHDVIVLDGPIVDTWADSQSLRGAADYVAFVMAAGTPAAEAQSLSKRHFESVRKVRFVKAGNWPDV